MVLLGDIKSAIVDREEALLDKFKSERIIERECLSQVKKFISTDVIVIITGVRRCGKSVFAFQCFESDRRGYVNFEDERLGVAVRDLNSVIEAVYSLKGDVSLLVFDEIQNVSGWERFVSRVSTGKKVIVTGSNARLMSKELSTFLTGRHIDFVLFPFSFREFLDYAGVEFDKKDQYSTKSVAKLKNFLERYLREGGFPLAFKLGRLFLIETYSDIIEKDVIQRYKIKYVSKLKELSRYLISNTSSELTYNRLKNILGLKSTHTVSNWIAYLENSYLFFKLERFSPKLKEQIKAPKKIYCIDTGLVNAVSFKLSQNYGKLVENAVAIELLRRKSYLEAPAEIYYWKDSSGKEVDFVLKEGPKVLQLIQVCYDLSDFETKKRELEGLLKASTELKCNNLLVVNADFEGIEEYKGKKIRFMPLWKWLLETT
ncbi:MAG: ATP-binding protein [Candidatus Diapherotrites archaeon]